MPIFEFEQLYIEPEAETRRGLADSHTVNALCVTRPLQTANCTDFKSVWASTHGRC